MNKTTENNNQPDAEDADIVDAEVVKDSPAPDSAAKMKMVQPPVTKKSSNAGWFTAALLTAFMGGVYGSPYFEAGLVSLGLRSERKPLAIAPPTTLATDLAPLKNQISDLKAASARHQEILAQQQAAAAEVAGLQAQLRTDIDLLAGAKAGASPVAATMDGKELVGLKAEITRLSDDLARLSLLSGEADPAVSAMSGGLALARAESAQLKVRLAAIEEMLHASAAGALEASPRGRLVLALSRMKDRALAGLPFGAEVTGLRVDISKLPALDQQMMGAEIAVLAGSGAGIQPYASLVRDFDPSVASALRAGEKADGSFLTSLFTSRRTDAGAAGDDAVFVKAERLLLARDLAGAVETLGALEGAVAEGIASWRSSAEIHVAVVRAFDRLIRAAAQTEPTANAGGTR